MLLAARAELQLRAYMEGLAVSRACIVPDFVMAGCITDNKPARGAEMCMM